MQLVKMKEDLKYVKISKQLKQSRKEIYMILFGPYIRQLRRDGRISSQRALLQHFEDFYKLL